VIPNLPNLPTLPTLPTLSTLAPQDQKSDKETNTECVFLQPCQGKARLSAAAATAGGKNDALVKRSQTFSPSAKINKSDYMCKV
jgi:protein KIBRA